MRMWSLDPRLLDRQGLVACWRESLLAQAVLAGNTSGYTNHPQLVRFKRTSAPLDYVGVYLHGIADEADRRSYTFDRSRVLLGMDDARRIVENGPALAVTSGQVEFEFEHLIRKLTVRNPHLLTRPQALVDMRAWDNPVTAAQVVHPLFTVVPGTIEEWERV